MGVLHEILIVVGVVLLLMIGWATSMLVRETFQQRRAAIPVMHEGHTCRNGVCALQN